jgi:hypothetical protein
MQPEIAMRWTVRVFLKNSWVVHYVDVIRMVAKINGQFRIDTSKPFEAAFYLDNAVAEIVPENE